MNNSLDFNIVTVPPSTAHRFNVDEVRKDALHRLPQLLSHLFPQGKVSSNNKQFTIGNVDGEPGHSMVIDIAGDRAGVWQDFATQERGDIFTLWAKCNGLSTEKAKFATVLESLAGYLHTQPATCAAQSMTTPCAKPLPTKPCQSSTQKWHYTDVVGNILATVSRTNTPEGKTFRVWDNVKKQHKAPVPRPLFNQPGMQKSDRIVLVEGEKCAEALIKVGITATTAMNGANAPLDKTDWSPLQDKTIVIWPDNDKPGRDYASKVGQYLSERGIATSISVLDIPTDKPDKWDAADAIAQGCDISAFIATHSAKLQSSYAEICPCQWQGTPPVRQWLIRHWLPRGYVTALYGDGGVGKSLLAQQLMTCLATGNPWLGLATQPSRVYGVLCEDDEDELWRRQHNINTALHLSMTDLNEIRFVSRVGYNNLLMTFDGKDSGCLTEFFNVLLARLIQFKPDVVVLDTAADLFGGNEINRSQVRQFVQNACGQIARQTNSAVLLCAHPSDSGIQRKTGTGGSTAWSNTVRSRWYLTRSTEADPDPNQRVLSRKKSNYAASGAELHLCWENGAFRHVTPEQKPKKRIGDRAAEKYNQERDRMREVIVGLIAKEALAGRVYSATTFAHKFEGEEKLGSASTIKRYLFTYAMKGCIKYAQVGDEYDLPKPPAAQGYLCVKDMQYKVGEEINPATGDVEAVTVPFYPTHFRSEKNGKRLQEVEDRTVWVEKKELKKG